jgi:hypothetical protein
MGRDGRGEVFRCCEAECCEVGCEVVTVMLTLIDGFE